MAVVDRGEAPHFILRSSARGPRDKITTSNDVDGPEIAYLLIQSSPCYLSLVLFKQQVQLITSIQRLNLGYTR